ncbi:Uncharacterised protein [Streptococcus pneumoniae]|nr:Uncharacterised protein [Streptococcus pneumoniae]
MYVPATVEINSDSLLPCASEWIYQYIEMK